MAIKQCPKCKEESKESATMCVICGTSLKDSILIGIKDSEKENVYKKNDKPAWMFDVRYAKIGYAFYLIIICFLFWSNSIKVVNQISRAMGLKHNVMKTVYLTLSKDDIENYNNEVASVKIQNNDVKKYNDKIKEIYNKYHKYVIKPITEGNHLVFILYHLIGGFIIYKVDYLCRNYAYKMSCKS